MVISKRPFWIVLTPFSSYSVSRPNTELRLDKGFKEGVDAVEHEEHESSEPGGINMLRSSFGNVLRRSMEGLIVVPEADRMDSCSSSSSL